jgi:hypothetical protein
MAGITAMVVKHSEQFIWNAKPCKREVIEIEKEETWQSRNVESKQKSQHVTWSLEYGTRRKQYLACPTQVHKS